MAATENADADIASLEAEIREAHDRLYPPRKRTTPLVETAANTTDSSRDQLLDVGLEPWAVPKDMSRYKGTAGLSVHDPGRPSEVPSQIVPG